MIRTILKHPNEPNALRFGLASVRLWRSFGDAAEIAKQASTHITLWEQSVRADFLRAPPGQPRGGRGGLPGGRRTTRDFYLAANNVLVHIEMEKIGVTDDEDSMALPRERAWGPTTSSSSKPSRRSPNSSRSTPPSNRNSVPSRRLPAQPPSMGGDTDGGADGDIVDDTSGEPVVELQMFDPDTPPTVPAQEVDDASMPEWAAVKTQFDRLTALKNGLLDWSPSVFALVRDDRLDEVLEQVTVENAYQAIARALRTSKASIAETMATGIDDTKLAPIHQQLFGRRTPCAVVRDWTVSIKSVGGSAEDQGGRGAEAVEGARLAAAGAAMFAVAAAGHGRAGAGLDGGRGRRLARRDKVAGVRGPGDGPYAAMARELALISQSQVNDALAEAVLETISVFIDVYGAAGDIAKLGRLAASQARLADQTLWRRWGRSAMKPGRCWGTISLSSTI